MNAHRAVDGKKDLENKADAVATQVLIPISDGLLKVLALRPVTWHWKQDKDKELQYGFIAQEVEKVIPNLVSKGVRDDGMTKKFLVTSDLIPYLIAAIQEQQLQITQLQKRLAKKPIRQSGGSANE